MGILRSEYNDNSNHSVGVAVDAQAAIRWYHEVVRPKLEKLSAESAADFDREVERVEKKLAAQHEERAICFLGSSGVGKSTLINALVAGKDRILPQGGIGPLTALATSVKYADEPYFKAEYLPAAKLNNLIFAIESSYKTELRQRGVDVPDASSDVQVDLNGQWEGESLAASTEEAKTHISDYKRQARLLVKGNQNGDIDVPYFADCLRSACGYKSYWRRNPIEEDQLRIAEIKERLSLSKNGVAKERDDYNANRSDFRRDLANHASGFLAPLIKTLEVGWKAEVLHDGMILVDLPGLGVANDEYQEVTLDWVRRQARGIVLVTDRSGIREAEAELLRNSGFLGRLLYSMDDPSADPVELIVAVVKVDASADDAWKDDKDANPGSSRSWNEHFAEKCREAGAMIVPQLRDELAKIKEIVVESIRSDFQEVVDRLLSQLEVHAVSAPQYSKFLAQDEDDRARIQNVEQSNIPALEAALYRVVRDRRQRIEHGLEEATDHFKSRLRSSLELIKNQWSDDSRTEKESEQLTKDLEEFLQPLREDLSTRKGAFREFLRRGLPDEIETLVEKAAADTEKQISIFLASLGDAHWATLRATVRRGGGFVGARHIDLPGTFAKMFEEPVAVIWSKKILSKLRKRTSELAEDYIALIKQVAGWAEQQGARVQPRVVRSLGEKMEADFKGLATVGREAVEELRETVRTKLLIGIQNPIRKRCETFVAQRRDVGPGVKKRILEFFGELVPEVIEVAKPAANSILQNNFNEVQECISQAFKQYNNPLDTAKDTIVSSHEDRLKRTNKRERQPTLDWVETALVGL